MSTETVAFRNLSLKMYTSDEPRVGDVIVTIDWDKIAKVLGTKAAFNRSGKSKMKLGITAKFVPSKKHKGDPSEPGHPDNPRSTYD